MDKHIKKWWVKIFIFFIAVVLTGVAYLAQARFLSSEPSNEKNIEQIEEKNAAPPVDNEQKTEKTDDLLSIIETPAAIQPEKIEKKVKTPLPDIERSKNPETRLSEAMVYTQPQILTGKYIDVSLTYQNLVIFQDGVPLKAYLISSGKRGLLTPSGTFKIENKVPRAWSKNYGLWMPYWMAFLPSGAMGIHELPEWPGGYKEGASHLGVPVSHGCIRLGIGSAKEVYDWAEIGTPVVIHK